MAKTFQERIQATLNYVRDHLGNEQRNELALAPTALGPQGIEQVSETLSLDSRAGDTNQRHALRALLLCHRLLINNAGVRDQQINTVRQAFRNTDEFSLRGRIASWFADSNSTPQTVSALAVANRGSMTHWNNNTLDPTNLVRGIVPAGTFNCYNAVVFWAFQGGAISLRWIWNHWFPATTINAQEAALLPGQMLALPPLNINNEHAVPEGHVVTMQRAGNPLGHTVMSIGNGNCISHNHKYDVLPAVADTEATPVKQNHARTAIQECSRGECHEMSIRFMAANFYTTNQGYTPRHHPPFWLSYPQDDR